MSLPTFKPYPLHCLLACTLASFSSVSGQSQESPNSQPPPVITTTPVVGPDSPRTPIRIVPTSSVAENEALDEAPQLPPPPAPLPILDMAPDGRMPLPSAVAPLSRPDASMEVISVDFPDEDVRVIIRNVAQLYGLNVVIPAELIGTTSIKLTNVTWQQVFEVVLEALDYTFVEEGNIIKIKSNADIVGEPPTIQVFAVNYANANDMLQSISQLVDPTIGSIKVDLRTNSLIVRERRKQLVEIQNIIDRLDRATYQVMIESKFVEVQGGNSRNLGLDWSSLEDYQLIGINGISRSYSRDLEKTTETTDGSTTESETINGFDLATGVSSSQTDTVTNVLGNTINDATTIGRASNAVLSAGDFQLVLNLLQRQNNSRIVTNPTVVTLDGEEANIDIGIQYPVPVFTFNPQTGTQEVSGFDKEDIGIKLAVTPFYNSAGFIRLEVNPQLTSLLDTVVFGQGTVPIVSGTTISTKVMLKDGFTLAIGGLMESTLVNTGSSVPFLSDVPLLGKLFKNKGNRFDETNLIVFITAKSLNPDGTSYRDIVDPRILDRMGILESDIPGYQLSEDQRVYLSEIDALRNQADRSNFRSEQQTRLELLRRAEAQRLEAALEEARKTEEATESRPTREKPFIRNR